MAEKDNRGAQELRKLFPEHGGVKKIADLCKVHQSVASRWRSGERAPEPPNRAILEQELGIDWRLWDEVVEPGNGDSGPGVASDPENGAAA